jgi:hypothetical protein
MAEEASIKITGEIDDYVAKIKKIPGITDKEAKKAADAWVKQLKRGQIKAALQATKSAKQASTAWKDAAESAKQAAEGVGGAAGGAAGGVEKFVRSVQAAGQAAGPAGIAVGVAGLAIAAIGIGSALAAQQVISLIGEVEALEESLAPFQDQGVFAPLPKETLDSVRQFNDSLSGLSAIVSSLKIELGGVLANALGDSAEAMLVAAFAGKELFDALGGVETALAIVGSGAGLLTQLIDKDRLSTHADALEWLGFGDSLDRWRNSASDAIGAARSLANAAGDVGIALEPTLAGFEKWTREQEREASKKAAAGARAHAAALREQADALREVNSFLAEEAAFFNQIRTAEIEAASASEKASADKLAAAQAADAEWDAFTVRALANVDRQIAKEKQLQDERAAGIVSAVNDYQMVAGAAIGFVSELAAAQIQAQEDVANRAKGRIETLQELRRETFDGEREMRTESEQADIDATRNDLEAKIKARRENIQSARQSAKKAAKAQKQLGRLDVAVNTAAAVTKAFALFGPPPSPPGIAAAAAAVLSGATQLSIINRQKPPQFHAGGQRPQLPSFTSTPDEVLALQLPGESTINQRGTDALGGPEAVERLNQTGGGGGGQGGAPMIVLDGRVIGRGVQRGIERGTISLGDRGGPVGVQDVFGAG